MWDRVPLVWASLIAASNGAGGPQRGDNTCSKFFEAGGKRPPMSTCFSGTVTNGPSPWVEKSVPRLDMKGSDDPAGTFPEFLHIAKNGGGSVLHLNFKNTSSGQESPKGYEGWGPPRFTRENETNKVCKDAMTPPRNTEKNSHEVWDWQTTFCVVRHPLTHLVSALNFDHGSSRKCSMNHACSNELPPPRGGGAGLGNIQGRSPFRHQLDPRAQNGGRPGG